MTMPHLMNCAHSGDGWCLDCVAALEAEITRLRAALDEIKREDTWIIPLCRNCGEQTMHMGDVCFSCSQKENQLANATVTKPPEKCGKCEANRKNLTCKICQNYPDESGELRHGRGCFAIDSDGGGNEYFNEMCPECRDTGLVNPLTSVTIHGQDHGGETVYHDGKVVSDTIHVPPIPLKYQTYPDGTTVLPPFVMPPVEMPIDDSREAELLDLERKRTADIRNPQGPSQ